MLKEDILHRFIFEDLNVRGEWVKLTKSWQEAKQHQNLGESSLQLLGQALAAVTLLSATVKFKGSMILQAQGNGDIRTLVAQATDQRSIRGLIRGKPELQSGTLESMFGQGQLVLTVEAETGMPYQGIVPLQGGNLSIALQTYFEQSEQLNTRLWLYANKDCAVGFFLQELPLQESSRQDWSHIEILANTITEQELFELDCEQLLYRLFHQEHIRLFDPEPIHFNCACTRANIERTLFALGRNELEEIFVERELIEVNCEFCSKHYTFDRNDIESLLFQGNTLNSSTSKH